MSCRRRYVAHVKAIEVVSDDIRNIDRDFIANPPGPYEP